MRHYPLTDKKKAWKFYGNMGCGVSEGGIQNHIVFWPKIKKSTYSKESVVFLLMNIASSCQKVPLSDFQIQFPMLLKLCISMNLSDFFI